jgi:predicted unusual protein kinase regulating ubiquinone biosynthesis (AarF/ABC1/UbiB family)
LAEQLSSLSYVKSFDLTTPLSATTPAAKTMALSSPSEVGGLETLGQSLLEAATSATSTLADAIVEALRNSDVWWTRLVSHLNHDSSADILFAIDGRSFNALRSNGLVQYFDTHFVDTNGLANFAPAMILVASLTTYVIVSALLNTGRPAPPTTPYPSNKYDPSTARRYYDDKLLLVLSRAVQIGALSSAFLFGIALDHISGNSASNAARRADELSALLAKLGPSFVKIGQSLSIRTDLLSPEYVTGLKSLQDQCPPFSTTEAIRIIESELRCNVDDVFVDFPKVPIAAASLGQVYRAVTRDEVVVGIGNGGGNGGREEEGSNVVAIKVQRPNIVNQIALDMYIIRETIAPFVKRTFNLNTDIVGVIDAWGTGFVDELDYIQEAVNAKSFSDSIGRTPLAGVVFAPPVVDELTTRNVLTTQWIVGERLDESTRDDVSVLCSIAMNSYLTMMLETGLLHCDPHPGNLLRTNDGRLCILDWGMVTRLDSELQITLIEHMAHLTSADYDEIPKDLLLLGFIPESYKDLIKDSGVVETLAEIYGAWTNGGGAASVNVNKVIADLQDLTAEKGNLFQIPPYFAYIAKSFSVLEGIGLSNDPKYSIINECLPYVSKRLLTDKSERTGGALSTFIFGPEKSNDDRIIDYNRVELLVTGFGQYTASSSSSSGGENNNNNVTRRAEIIDNVATQVLDLLITEDETPLQKIFIEQLAKIITSSTRSAWSSLRVRSGVLPSGRTVLGSLVDPLGVFKYSPIVRVDELDERTVETTRNLIQLLLTQTGGGGGGGGFSMNSESSSSLMTNDLSSGEISEITSIIASKLFTRRNGLVKTSNRLVMQLLQLTADRLEKDGGSGGRDIVVIPTLMKNDADTATTSSSRQTIINRGDDNDDDDDKKRSSNRLASARRILASVE